MLITARRPFFIPSLLCHSGSLNPGHGLLFLLLCLLLLFIIQWTSSFGAFFTFTQMTVEASYLPSLHLLCSSVHTLSEHLASTHWVTCIRSLLAPLAGPFVQIRRRCSLEPASRWKGQEVPPAPEAAALMHRDELKLSPTHGLSLVGALIRAHPAQPHWVVLTRTVLGTAGRRHRRCGSSPVGPGRNTPEDGPRAALED